MLEGWFINVPLERIHRDNLASWSAWAFFDTDYKELTKEETVDNELIVDFIAKAAKWDFPLGVFSAIYKSISCTAKRHDAIYFL